MSLDKAAQLLSNDAMLCACNLAKSGNNLRPQSQGTPTMTRGTS